MDLNTKLTLQEFINLFNSESEFWDAVYLEGSNIEDIKLIPRNETEIH